MPPKRKQKPTASTRKPAARVGSKTAVRSGKAHHTADGHNKAGVHKIGRVTYTTADLARIASNHGADVGNWNHARAAKLAAALHPHIMAGGSFKSFFKSIGKGITGAAKAVGGVAKTVGGVVAPMVVKKLIPLPI